MCHSNNPPKNKKIIKSAAEYRQSCGWLLLRPCPTCGGHLGSSRRPKSKSSPGSASAPAPVDLRSSCDPAPSPARPNSSCDWSTAPLRRGGRGGGRAGRRGGAGKSLDLSSGFMILASPPLNKGVLSSLCVCLVLEGGVS